MNATPHPPAPSCEQQPRGYMYSIAHRTNCLFPAHHRDRYPEHLRPGPIDTEVKDIEDMIRYESQKCMHPVHGAAFWGVTRALQSDINLFYPPPVFISLLINEDLPFSVWCCSRYLSLWTKRPRQVCNKRAAAPLHGNPKLKPN